MSLIPSEKEKKYCKHCGLPLVLCVDEYDEYTGVKVRTHKACPDRWCQRNQIWKSFK